MAPIRGGLRGHSLPQRYRRVEELADDLKRKPAEVRLLVNALLREGSIVKLNTDREGGPFYAPRRFAAERRS